MTLVNDQVIGEIKLLPPDELCTNLIPVHEQAGRPPLNDLKIMVINIDPLSTNTLPSRSSPPGANARFHLQSLPSFHKSTADVLEVKIA